MLHCLFLIAFVLASLLFFFRVGRGGGGGGVVSNVPRPMCYSCNEKMEEKKIPIS